MTENYVRYDDAEGMKNIGGGGCSNSNNARVLEKSG